jgi:hypothetical protein
LRPFVYLAIVLNPTRPPKDFVIPTRERSETGEPALSEAEGNPLSAQERIQPRVPHPCRVLDGMRSHRTVSRGKSGDFDFLFHPQKATTGKGSSASRFSKTVPTGIRVPFNTDAPFTLAG